MPASRIFTAAHYGAYIKAKPPKAVAGRAMTYSGRWAIASDGYRPRNIYISISECDAIYLMPPRVAEPCLLADISPDGRPISTRFRFMTDSFMLPQGSTFYIAATTLTGLQQPALVATSTRNRRFTRPASRPISTFAE